MQVPVRKAEKPRGAVAARLLGFVQRGLSAQCVESHCQSPASCSNALQTSMEATPIEDYSIIGLRGL